MNMNKSDFDRSDAINLVLEEYRSLENEKRSISQGSYALASLVVIGTIGVLTAMMQTHNPPDRLFLMLALLIGQLALVAVAIIMVAMSVRFGMYLAVVEQRINRLGGRNLLIWERKGVENWPSSYSFKLKEIAILLRSQDPFIRAIWFLGPLIVIVIIGEITYIDMLMWELIDNIGLRILATVGSIVVTAVLIGLGVRNWISLTPWSRDLYRGFLAAENEVIIRHAIEEFNNGNLSILDELIAADVKNHDTSYTWPTDPEGVKQLLTSYRSSYPDLHMTVEGLQAKDDEVTFRWIAQSRRLNDPVDNKVVTRNAKVRMVDGKIVEYWSKAE